MLRLRNLIQITHGQEEEEEEEESSQETRKWENAEESFAGPTATPPNGIGRWGSWFPKERRTCGGINEEVLQQENMGSSAEVKVIE